MIRVGTDIIEIHRMEQAMQKESFLHRVFTEYERTYAWGRNKQASASFAGIFAAKEACVKALGIGFRYGSWQDIEVSHDAWGAPVLTCSGYFGKQMKALGYDTLQVSISHCREYATSTVIVY